MKISKPKEKLITCLVIAVMVAVMYGLGLPCPFKAIFHIPCPGCGMTRAYLSLLRLDFAAAFAFHPMFWSVPILLADYLLDGRIFKWKWLNTALIAGIFLGFFLNWIFMLI